MFKTKKLEHFEGLRLQKIANSQVFKDYQSIFANRCYFPCCMLGLVRFSWSQDSKTNIANLITC